MLRPIVTSMLAGVVVLWAGAPASAQTRSGTSSSGFGSSGGPGGGGGGPGGGLGGSSSGSGFGTSNSGSTGFGSTTGGTTGGGNSGNQAYGSNTPFGPYYGNPLAIGFPSGTSASSSASLASKYSPAFPVQLSFGQVISSSSTTTGGTATLNRGTTGGIGSTSGTASVTNNLFPGANSAGFRRVPAYISEPVFDRPARMSGEALRTDLQQVVSRSGRLPSRGDIQVSVDGAIVVLRGNVRNERERRLAEAVVRLTPGVRQVENLLQYPKK